MKTWSQFSADGGLRALNLHSHTVEVLKVGDIPNIGSSFVDIRFGFWRGTPAYFTKNAAVHTDENVHTESTPLTTRKTVSMISDDVAVVNDSGTPDEGGPIPEDHAKDHGVSSEGKQNLEMGKPQEAVYMPDSMWISRTEALSSMLEKLDPVERHPKDTPTASVISACDSLAVELSSGSDSISRDEAFNGHNSGAAFTPSSGTTRDAMPSQEEEQCLGFESSRKPHRDSLPRERTLKEVFRDRNASSKLDAGLFNKTAVWQQPRSDEKNAAGTGAYAASDTVNEGPSVRDEVPKGCAFLRLPSLKAAAQTTLERISPVWKSEVSEDHATDAGLQGTCGKQSVSFMERKTEERTEPEDEHVRDDVPLSEAPEDGAAAAENGASEDRRRVEGRWWIFRHRSSDGPGE